VRLTALALGAGWLLVARGAVAADSFAWAPADSPAVVRGRQVASRFDQESLFEISVEVNNAFSLDNRRAIAVAEEELRRVPGVRRVFGPSPLVDLSIDGAGRISGRPVLDRGSGEGEDEAARQRVVRRADALGWFLSPDGSRVRFLVDTDDPVALQQPLSQAIASSGLQLLHAAGAHLGGEALWPQPGDAAARWSSSLFAGLWIMVALWGGRWLLRSVGRYPRRRRWLVIGAGAAGACALFALCAVVPVRAVAWRGAGVAALSAALGLWRDPPTVLPGLARRPAPIPPAPSIVVAALLVLVAAWLAPRVPIATQQWRRTPFLLVSVRGDLEQPVVLREVRRLADFVRAQPGVANAWSVADLFFGVAQAGDQVGRVPDAADEVRLLLAQARTDPALALEIAPDHREGLVVARFDDDAAPVDRLQIHDRVARYLRTELRAALVAVDLTDPHLPPATRQVGRGLLASDAAERIVRISARSGRALNDGEIAAAERVARQAAVVPAADLGKLKAEISAQVRDFLQGNGGGYNLTPAQRARLADELAAASPDTTVDDVRRTLAAHLGAPATDERVTAMAQALQPRLAQVRLRHAARINFRTMLYGADLPTEGMLSDEVRSATLDAMGSVAGIPVAVAVPGAFHLDAVAVGGAANDRALSDYLRPGLRGGGIFAGAILAALLLAAAGARGLLWWPVGLSPAAVALIAPALFGEPVGMLFLSFLSGALAGGAVWAVALAARRTV
jgi:hypothetical protein